MKKIRIIIWAVVKGYHFMKPALFVIVYGAIRMLKMISAVVHESW